MRKTLSKTGNTSLRGIGPVAARSHGTLHPWVNHKVNSKRVAEKRIGDTLNIGALEIELHASAAA